MTGRNGDRGIVLLVVLWTLALLALMSAAITGTGRREAGLGIALRSAAAARAGAEAALHETLYNLVTGRRRADGVTQRLPVGSATAAVTVRSEDGKLNPNTAPAETLAALVRAVGGGPSEASALAAAVVAWRGRAGSSGPDPAVLATYRAAGRTFGPPGSPFLHLEELRLVLGVTPALYAALAPHLSVYPDGVLDPDAADPVVRRALELAGVAATASGGVQQGGPATVSVAVRLQGADGTVARLSVVVRLDPNSPDKPAAILSWDEPDDDG
jgi:general secretion pathway protein K